MEMGGCQVKYLLQLNYEFIYWHCLNTTRHAIPFSFIVKLPKPQKLFGNR